MRFKGRLPVIMVLAFVMTLPSIAFARRLQGRNSRWTVIEFPQGQQVDIGFKVVNAAIVKGFPRETWSAPASRSDEPEEINSSPERSDSFPEFAAGAKISRSATTTTIRFSLYRLPRNSTYYLYVIGPFGVVKVFTLNRSNYETSVWKSLQTDADTFMLALSISGTLTDIETDKNVFMISQPPQGFRIAPKGP